MARKRLPEEEKRRRTALFFDQDEMDRLRELSDHTGAPVAELVRRAVSAYLDSRKEELKRPKK